MKCQAADETVQRVSAALCEVRSEAITADVFHLMLVRERWDDVGREILAEGFVEKDKIGEAAADAERGLFKRGEIALGKNQQRRFKIPPHSASVELPLDIRSL